MTHQNGLSTALHVDLVHRTGSYCTGGRSGLSFSGVYIAARGTTIRVASKRLDGHTFQLNRTPSRSSFCCMYSWYVCAILCYVFNEEQKTTVHHNCCLTPKIVTKFSCIEKNKHRMFSHCVLWSSNVH